MVGRALNNQELQQFSSEIPGLQELRRWSLYDRLVFAGGATIPAGDSVLFTTPIGQAGKTLLDTNMRQAGQLPARQGFEVWDIRVQVQATGTLGVSSDTSVVEVNNLYETMNAILYGASFTYRYQASKVDLEIAPLAILGAGYGITNAAWGGSNITAGAAAGAGASIFSNGHPSKAGLYDMDPLPLVILPQRTFQVILNFPVAVVLNANQGANIWVHLDGVLHRNA